jgi:hypothetical protein
MLFAHTGPCRAPEVVSTLGIAGVAATLLFRPWRRRGVRERLIGFAVPLALAAVVTGGACANKTQSSSGARPTTSAQLVVESPAPNESVAPDFTLRLRLIGATVVNATTGKLTGTEGHIHVSIDNKLVSMAYGTSQDLHGIAPGGHNIRAEFVAIDHKPFKNRVIAAVLFTVRAP